MEQPAPPPGEPARRTLAVAVERGATFLGRLQRSALRLAVVALAAGAVVWWAVLRGVGSDEPLTLVLMGVLLAAPPAVLLLFVVAVGAILALPARLRAAPGAVRGRVDEVRLRAREAARARERGGSRSALAIFRLVRSVISSRELIGVVSPAAALVSPALVLGAALAAALAVVEVLAGVVALVWLAAR